MEVPILKQCDFLIATIQSALTDHGLTELRDQLVQQVKSYRTRGVIVDVTALDVLDSFSSRTLRDLSYMISLQGARTVIVGIQPELAFAMVQLGVTLDNIPIALDLDEGLEFLNSKGVSNSRTTAHRHGNK